MNGIKAGGKSPDESWQARMPSGEAEISELLLWLNEDEIDWLQFYAIESALAGCYDLAREPTFGPAACELFDRARTRQAICPEASLTTH